jgi:DNA-binding transcriptional MerR regulator
MPKKNEKSKRAAKSGKGAGRKVEAVQDGFDAASLMDAEKDRQSREALLASDKLYYRIGEVSRLTGVKAHVLRYWETEFRWMAPPKSRSKQRLYRGRDIEFVWLLKRLLWEERYTIAGARQRIQELGVDGALGLLDVPAGVAPVSAGSGDGPSEAASEGDSASTQSQAEWVVLRAALDEIHSDLTLVRGALQEGA